MSFLHRLFSSLRERKGAVATVTEETIGKGPSVALSDQIEALKDPMIRAAVDWLAEAAVGMGFYTTAETTAAKEAVDRFCEDVDLDGLNLIIAREAIATGNSFLEKVEPNALETLTLLPLSSFKRIARDVYGNLKYYEQRWGGETEKLEPERVIHFRWNPVDVAGFGTGLLSPLVESREYVTKTDTETKTHTVPPFVRIKAQMEDDMRRILHRYLPRSVYVFEGASDAFVGNVTEAIKNIEPEQDFVVNQSLEVREVAVDPRARFEGYTTYLENQMIAGLQTPIIKLFTTPGFTEASAKEASIAVQRKVAAYQRFHKRIVEREIFRPVVEQAGLSWQRARVRLNWGIHERPEVKLEDVFKAVEEGVIRVDEARKMLVKVGFELYEPQKAEAPEKVAELEKLRNLRYQSRIHEGGAGT